jgi:hypothetical protein
MINLVVVVVAAAGDECGMVAVVEDTVLFLLCLWWVPVRMVMSLVVVKFAIYSTWQPMRSRALIQPSRSSRVSVERRSGGGVGVLLLLLLLLLLVVVVVVVGGVEFVLWLPPPPRVVSTKNAQ